MAARRCRAAPPRRPADKSAAAAWPETGATRGEAPRTAYAGREAPHLIQRLEEYFGIAFPYPKLDLIASPLGGGAMENARAIIFDDSLLLFAEHPTDAEQPTFGTVAAHEMAHQWFGDLVTPVWWDDIWLNESFAEWMGVKIASAWRPDLGIAIDQLSATLRAMNTDALQTGRPIHQPITSAAQINSTFDDITYQKGAGVLGVIESYLGEVRFRKGVQLHLQTHPYGTATAAEFFAAMAQGSGDPGVTEAFRSFVDQAGVPLIKVSAQGRVLFLEQSRYRPLGSAGADGEAWKVPVCVDAISAAQHAKSCTLLSAGSGTLTLGAGAAGATLHPNADGAGYYRFAVDERMFRALVAAAPQLPAREALSFADSVGAAFDAGRLPFAHLLAAAAVLAKHPDRSAALNLGDKLRAIRDLLASPAERPAIERTLVEMYKPRLRAIGFDPAAGRYASESGEQRLLRESLVSLVALGGRDAEVRAMLSKAALRSLSDPKALDAGLRRTAWSVAVQEQGNAFADKTEPRVFTSPDPHVRRDAVTALANAQSAPVADAARALVLDKRADVSDALIITTLQIRNPLTRAAAWSWLRTHREAVLARVPEFFQADLATLGTSFCSAGELNEFESVLGERLSKVSGGELQVGRARTHRRLHRAAPGGRPAAAGRARELADQRIRSTILPST